mgnify:CR=1 FL=1
MREKHDFGLTLRSTRGPCPPARRAPFSKYFQKPAPSRNRPDPGPSRPAPRMAILGGARHERPVSDGADAPADSLVRPPERTFNRPAPGPLIVGLAPSTREPPPLVEPSKRTPTSPSPTLVPAENAPAGLPAAGGERRRAHGGAAVTRGSADAARRWSLGSHLDCRAARCWSSTPLPWQADSCRTRLAPI